jgi:uncharacterized protein (TIGR03382 family)
VKKQTNEVKLVKASWSRVATAVLFGIGLASTCLAQSQVVPEIDASSGAMASTLVVGVVVWVLQARRRR